MDKPLPPEVQALFDVEMAKARKMARYFDTFIAKLESSPQTGPLDHLCDERPSDFKI